MLSTLVKSEQKPTDKSKVIGVFHSVKDFYAYNTFDVTDSINYDRGMYTFHFSRVYQCEVVILINDLFLTFRCQIMCQANVI